MPCFLLFVFLLVGWVFSPCLGASPVGVPIKITADSFEFDSTRKLVLAAGTVRMIQGDITITGKTAVYDQSMNNVFIQGPVTLENNKFHLRCDSVTAYGQEERIVASKNVFFYVRKNHRIFSKS